MLSDYIWDYCCPFLSLHAGVGPPTITIDREIVAPAGYSEIGCSDSLNKDGNNTCRVNCSVPTAYNALDDTLTIHWEFDSRIVPDKGAVRQEMHLEQDPPYVLLIFTSFNKEMNGEYHCHSNNTHSVDIDTVTVIGKQYVPYSIV